MSPRSVTRIFSGNGSALPHIIYKVLTA